MALNKVPMSELSNNVRDSIEIKASIISTTYDTNSKIYNAATITGDLDITNIQDQKLWVKFEVTNDASNVKFSLNGKTSVPILDSTGLPLDVNTLLDNVVYDCNYMTSEDVLYVNTQAIQGYNTLIYDSIPPIPSGADNKYTYEDFFNHFIVYGQCTVLSSSGLDFPNYYPKATFGTKTTSPVVLSYCSLKWEVFRDKSTVRLEMYFPEINETYITTSPNLQVLLEEDCPVAQDSTVITASNWDRVNNEVAYSMYSETKLFLNFVSNDPNDLTTKIKLSRTDGQPFTSGMNLSYKGVGGFNASYENPGHSYQTPSVLKAYTNDVDVSRSAQKGYGMQVGKEGETNSSNKFVNKSFVQSGQPYLDLSAGQDDFHFVSGDVFVHEGGNGLGSVANFADSEVINKSTGDTKIEKGVFGVITSNIKCVPNTLVKEITLEHSTLSTGTVRNAFLYVDVRSCDPNDIKLLKVEYL